MVRCIEPEFFLNMWKTFSELYVILNTYTTISLQRWKFIIAWFSLVEIRKVLKKIAKIKGCEVVDPWVKPCENHLYWSALSTSDGNGKVILAKFNSFLSHIVNKHTEIDNPLFSKCAHDEIPHRTWLDKSQFNKQHCILLCVEHLLISTSTLYCCN